MNLRKTKDIVPVLLDKCHDGDGTLVCRDLLDGCGSKDFLIMHSNDMVAGVSIGEHIHTHNEEIYYLVSGKGILTYDGKEYEMLAGDVSLCKVGHSHAFKAIENCVLIVVGGILK